MSIPVTRALEQWRSRSLFPTDLSSAELRTLSSGLRMRSVFSARTTNSTYLAKVAEVLDELLAGKINEATGRLELKRMLARLGYDPAVGFPQDMADIPPAERGSLQDLSSSKRINLLLEINRRVAVNYGIMVAGNKPYARYEYPAYELVRLYDRNVPRGSSDSHSVGWEPRWEDAGAAVNWEGAIAFPMVALKDSPIWPALGDGEGGYTDTLGNPFPPFGFGSGLGWREVPRREVERYGLLKKGQVPGEMKGTITPGQREIADAFRRLPEDLRNELERELAETEEEDEAA